MMKILITLVLIAAAVAGYLYYAKSQDRGPIGDPVLSATPSGMAPVASETAFTDGVYRLDPAASRMTWQGHRPFVEGYFDNGTIALKEGFTVVTGGTVASGSVVVDMTTIAATSTGRGTGQDRLSTHLKSADFFEVETYPTAVFTLSGMTPHAGNLFSVDGTLTLKGITQPVAFSATVTQDGDMLTMSAAKVTLDRTLWNVKYGSGKFFKELVGDNLVGDTFDISFTAVGKLER